MALEKFKQALQKKGDRYNIGFSPIPDWISTGNCALNAIISGRMDAGIPVSRTTAFSGLNGTGKSFLDANLIKNAQEKGYFCVLLDTENSLGEGFMEKIGVDLDEDKFMAVSVYSVEDAMSFVSDLFKNTDKEDKIGIFIDSLSNLEMENDIKKNAEAGNVAYGFGQLQKAYKQLIRFINTQIGNRNAFCVFVAHEYVSGTDNYGNQLTKPSVGEGTLYLPSVAVSVKKSDLKDGKEQAGIVIKAQTLKTRYTMVKQKCEINLPWDQGMNPYDGMIPFLEKGGIVARNGAWYSYETEEGETVKFQNKNISDHAEVLIRLYSKREGDIVEQDEEEAHMKYVESEASKAESDD